MEDCPNLLNDYSEVSLPQVSPLAPLALRNKQAFDEGAHLYEVENDRQVKFIDFSVML